MRNLIVLIFILCVFSNCTVGKNYNPSKKYSSQQLIEDYSLFRAGLEDAHPSLYWYTPKDSMDFYFEVGKAKLNDSLTEAEFKNVLSYVTAKIRCGHTTVRSSKAATAFSGGQSALFPLFIKAWPDTVVVTANLNRRDSNITRGVMLKSIDRKPINFIIDSLFSFLSADGYNTTHKYQTLSNGSMFRNLYASAFGLKQHTEVEFIDTFGTLRRATLNLYNPKADTPRRNVVRPKLPSKKEQRKLFLESLRNMHIDTSLHAAFMEVNTFTKGNGLRRFFRKSFRQIKQQHIQNLVIDMRANGGGSVTLSNLLTKYIADAPFKIADSLYAIRRGSDYGKYREQRVLNWLFLRFLTHKRIDGKYHFGLFENKLFKPKTKNHFDGTTYILTGGNTFSAASLFAKSLRQQDDVIVVGEETGGGAYGNTAWLIPDVTLPNTGVRFRLPLFRLVVDKEEEKGRGIQPEVFALPGVEAIRRNEDYKMEKVKRLIREKMAK
ncbi:MAG: S41 family peptidase [Bacteroidota bacterium]|nr:S41 family peptidase [Bacteroidota bacterium]